MLKKYSFIFSLLMTLLLTACEIPSLSTPDDGPPVEISEEAAASLEQKAVEAATANGVSTITITQEEATSYFTLRVMPLAEQNGIQNPLQQPQIYFKGDGTVVLRSNIDFQGQKQTLRVVARPTVANGSLQVDITEGSIGPAPVPESILNQVEGQLAEAILAGQSYARLGKKRCRMVSGYIHAKQFKRVKRKEN